LHDLHQPVEVGVCGCKMAVGSLAGVEEGAQRREGFQRAFIGEEVASVESLSADVGGVTAPYLDRVIQRADNATRAPQQKHRAPDQAITIVRVVH
jgi:hypothetical protein